MPSPSSTKRNRSFLRRGLFRFGGPGAAGARGVAGGSGGSSPPPPRRRLSRETANRGGSCLGQKKAPEQVCEPVERGAESSIARMPDLTRNAVDVLPEGRLAEQLELGRPLRVKLGIDPTTADIHLGHTVVLTKLREFQDAGHKVVLIIGDFTARVGAPTGRAASRPGAGAEQIEANATTYQEQAYKILDPARTEVRRNGEWLDMNLADLLKLMGTATGGRVRERGAFPKGKAR